MLVETCEICGDDQSILRKNDAGLHVCPVCDIVQQTILETYEEEFFNANHDQTS